MDMARELAPCTEPLISASSGPFIPHARLGTWEELVTTASASASGTRGQGAELLKGNPIPVCTFHAEPGALRNFFQADAVGVIRGIAAIAQEQDVLMICGVADWTRCNFLLFLGILVQPCKGIELGHLFLVFYFVCA